MRPALRMQRALQAWVLLGLLCFSLLPWYFLQDMSLLQAWPGVWGAAETASALVQAAQHGRPWLWMGLAGLVICGLGVWTPVTALTQGWLLGWDC